MKTKPAWRRFLALWLFMLLIFVAAKSAFTLVMYGWIDLRIPALLEALLMPSIQTVLLWFAFRLDQPRA